MRRLVSQSHYFRDSSRSAGLLDFSLGLHPLDHRDSAGDRWDWLGDQQFAAVSVSEGASGISLYHVLRGGSVYALVANHGLEDKRAGGVGVFPPKP